MKKTLTLSGHKAKSSCCCNNKHSKAAKEKKCDKPEIDPVCEMPIEAAEHQPLSHLANKYGLQWQEFPATTED